jgi:squamous cell carcinoma antigen recognized by T-cells 3
MRALLERAITEAGFHVSEGSKIWEAYREYEQALLLIIDEENNEVGYFLLSFSFTYFMY